MRKIRVISTPLAWRSMWVFALFDLPTQTKVQRKVYTTFRKALLRDGFTMMQYSVYRRHCATKDKSQIHIERMGKLVPSQGEVRFIQITDHQYGDMRIFTGKKRGSPRDPPAQLEFF